MSDQERDSFQARVAAHEAMRQHPLVTAPILHQPRGKIPNTPLAVVTIAFSLGALASLGALTFTTGGFPSIWWATYQLGFFVAAWATFHWAEFAVTAGWNLEKCSVDSFLLENGVAYHIANAAAVSEYLFGLYLFPNSKALPYVTFIGIALVFLGQALRSMAMVHAATSFSHQLAFKKLENHRLVTTGVYGWFRHPSYAGFFYWALGTQLVLQNPVTLIGYSIVLWRFFYYRTRAEERALIKFFGDEYVAYSKRVGTKIPFVP